MGLQDLLAVVFGVKTAEALQERERMNSEVGSTAERITAEIRAKSAIRQAEQERLTPEWEAASKPILDRFLVLAGLSPTPLPVWVWGLSEFDELYAARLSGGDYTKYRRARSWHQEQARVEMGVALDPRDFPREGLERASRVLATVDAADARLFDELVDAFLACPDPMLAEGIQWMRRVSGLGPLVRLPTTKPCPRCAETVKRAAQVCRFCGYEFQAGDGVVGRA